MKNNLIIFDIDGVLTVKATGVNINVKMTDEEIKRNLLNAKPAQEGFNLLYSFWKGFVQLYHGDEARAWQHIAFNTGRKKSVYEKATECLFLQWQISQKIPGDWAKEAIKRVFWYPETAGYGKFEYFQTKSMMMEPIIEPTGNLYIDDEASLIDYFQNDHIKPCAFCHFEAKQ